ncbi:EamA family transporter [Celeribacter neptunius]|uniref:Probable blue pigment (Indigoidine) exporter n=1 Tax=Celeribacter neptunius TaxID=588602 RepID=A0A1I3LV44_9RHOB|nr:EamA family transporter [Celeribacter neptunius]SFI88567.1 probable blue pigment (indigoidine) exporter [Celeribacter neptunius]
MSRTDPKRSDIALTALAPTIWGATYLVTTRLLPEGVPITVALLRALPAGLLLLLFLRRLPPLHFVPKLLVLGALNFTLFFTCLFIAAYRLPGGVAATLGATQPLIVLILARIALQNPIRPLAVVAGLAGILGVACLVLSPEAQLDATGVIAALIGALSMATGTVMSRKWAPDAPALVFTSWQLIAGGVLLLPLALTIDPPLPPLTLANVSGFLFLGLIGGALAYFLFFRGIATIGPERVAPLGFLSPVTAVLLGVFIAHETLSPLQMLGMALVLGSVWLGQYAQTRTARPRFKPA